MTLQLNHSSADEASFPMGASSSSTAWADSANPAEQLDQSVAKATDFQTVTAAVVRWIEKQSRCIGVWITNPGSDDDLFALNKSARDNEESIRDAAKQQLECMHALPQTQIAESKRIANRLLISSPVVIRGELKFILLGLFDASAEQQDRLIHLIDTARRVLGNWCLEQEYQILTESTHRNTCWTGLSNSVLRSQSMEELTLGFANQFKRALGIDHFVIAKGNDENWELTAISDCPEIDLKNSFQKELKRSLGEMRADGMWWSHNEPNAEDRNEDAETDAVLDCFHRLKISEWAAWEIKQGVSAYRFLALRFPARENPPAQPRGSRVETIAIDTCRDFAIKAESLIGDQSSVSRLVRSLKATVKTRPRKFVFATIISLMLVLLLPLHYRPACDFELRPVMRRFVSAPFDSVLDECLVERGEEVTVGQTLALLDDEKVAAEKRALEAKVSAAKARSDAARAEGKIAEALIARTEMKRAIAELELIEQQLSNLMIVSPLTGVVVSGELDKAEGAPLETGQVLFEIAPLENFIVETKIPEREIAYVREGMTVEYQFNAYPLQTHSGILKKIHPKAKLVDNELVFIGEVEFRNEAGLFRPGLSGTASIVSGRRPLGWNLFHRTFESTRQWLTW